MTTQDILQKAKAESLARTLTSEEKNLALKALADAVRKHADDILKANIADCENAKDQLTEVMMDRLRLNAQRIEAMAKGIEEVIRLEDPVGTVLEERMLYNNIQLKKVMVPMGVIALIYESRPNVTTDAAALALKAGSCIVLRTGRNAYNSARALVSAMQEGLLQCGIAKERIQLIEDISHDSAEALMRANGYVDLLIPRGGAGLIRNCIENATVPIIETGTGICHVYVDEDADLNQALKIIENAKTSRPSVCNAEEVCLVHASVAQSFLPRLKECLSSHKPPVELRLDLRAQQIISGTPASKTDFDMEFLDYILAVKVVDNVEEAIAHINAHGTHHSDAIVTRNTDHANLFTTCVDSACVYVNASTRFTDGGEFGLGCEMGISTQKLHARGPMGLKELCTYKYVLTGDGQIR